MAITPNCPHCKGKAITKQTRIAKLGEATVLARRRRCTSCDFRWTTYELPEAAGLIVLGLTQLMKDKLP